MDFLVDLNPLGLRSEVLLDEKMLSTCRRHAERLRQARRNLLTDQIQLESATTENVATAAILVPALSVPCPHRYAGPCSNLTSRYSTVPTQEQILVPETLLKKRKSQEKARAERTAAQEKKKAVSTPPYSLTRIMMHNIPFQLDSGQCR